MTTVGEALIEELRDRAAEGASRWRPDAEVKGLRPLTGGTSSLTFLIDFEGGLPGESPAVLKVAPPGLAPVRNRDVLRQGRLQQALQDRGRTFAPNVLFADEGAPPDVPPFYAMSMVAGDCIEPVLSSEEERLPAPVVQARFLDASALLAELHALVPAEIGLGDEPVVGLADEVDRWSRAFATLPEEMQGNYVEVAKALHDTLPPMMSPVINHGDFRLGNALCERGRINAVIDWEIWSVGDPRVDVSWFSFFTDGSGHPAIEPGLVAGTPSAAQLVDAYEAAAGRELADLDWFHALTRFKESGITGLLLKRAAKDGRELKPALARMWPALQVLLDDALRILEKRV